MVFLLLNDCFDDLNTELNRLKSELLFANQCIEVLFKFKLHLDSICRKMGHNFDPKLTQELQKLNKHYKHVIDSCGQHVTTDEVKTPKEEAPEVMPEVTREVAVGRVRPLVRKYRKARDTSVQRYVFKCDWIGCYFVTNRNSRLRAHNNYHTGIRPFKCNSFGCHKSFVGREALTTHVKSVHKTDRALRCSILKYVRQRSPRVKAIKQEVKGTGDEKPYKCDQTDCPYRSRTRQALREHRLTHLERTLKCTFNSCEKVFKNKKQLKNHVLTHSVDPPHKCPFQDCSAAFRTYKTLKIHRLKHTNETPKFECDWPGCEFSSVYNWILRRHRMVHTGEKPYKCAWPSCESRFRRNHYLKAHMLKHSGEKPYSCDWPGCERRFQSKQALRVHSQKTHAVEVVSDSKTLVSN